MCSRIALLSAPLLFFASVLCIGQTTATCTNWNFFKLPSPWVGTYPRGINQWGTIVGQTSICTSVKSCTNYGFTRFPDKTSRTFTAPNASSTFFTRRNKNGVNVGIYTDNSSNPHIHGFLLSGNNFANLDYPGATDTELWGINSLGTIVGAYTLDQYQHIDGFKLKNGVFTRIHYPGSVSTWVRSINDLGVMVGYYHVYQGPPYIHGFVLADGVYTTLDYPHAIGDTVLNDINNGGVIVGSYYIDHGFIYINGQIKDIKVPNFGLSTADAINKWGVITGTTLGSSSYKMFTVRCQ